MRIGYLCWTLLASLPSRSCFLRQQEQCLEVRAYLARSSKLATFESSTTGETKKANSRIAQEALIKFCTSRVMSKTRIAAAAPR